MGPTLQKALQIVGTIALMVAAVWLISGSDLAVGSLIGIGLFLIVAYATKRGSNRSKDTLHVRTHAWVEIDPSLGPVKRLKECSDLPMALRYHWH